MKKVIVITGPTASGKTSLSIEMALKYNGEIISADSRQVFKGLDVGSAKVTKEEMKGVKHYLIDVVKPEQYFSVMDFKRKAERAIEEIDARGKIPIVIGGTYFWIKALADNYQMPEVEVDPKLREELSGWSREDLISFLKKKSPEDLEHLDQKNPRRLQRAVEVVKLTGKPFHSQQSKGPRKFEFLKFAIDWPREELYKRIDERVDERWEGIVREIKELLDQGVSAEWLKNLGLEYKFVTMFVLDELGEDEAKQQLKFAIHNFSRKQMTWMRKDEELTWIKPELADAEKQIERFLDNTEYKTQSTK